jgi:hypothetical protein
MYTKTSTGLDYTKVKSTSDSVDTDARLLTIVYAALITYYTEELQTVRMVRYGHTRSR